MAKLKTGRHTSALKAHRQELRRMLRNRAIKRKARLATKALLAAIAAKDADKLKTELPASYSAWDKAAKGVIHWKTAARKKSRLAFRVAQTHNQAAAPASR